MGAAPFARNKPQLNTPVFFVSVGTKEDKKNVEDSLQRMALRSGLGPAELKRLVEEAAELCRVRRRSTKLNESYAKNLLALREALSKVKQQADVHPSLPAEDKTSWGTMLERAIRWIEHPESDF